MKVYISSHDVERAREAAAAVEAAGHSVVSTWHLGSGPMKRAADMTADEMVNKARANAHQIGLCDALLLVASADKVPGGKFVEAGVAIGRGKRVAVWGRRENVLMHHPRVGQADDLGGAVALLGAVVSDSDRGPATADGRAWKGV